MYHLGEHFWNSDEHHHQPSLYHRLQDHYEHSHIQTDDGDYGQWEGVVYEVPVHHEHDYRDGEHRYHAHTV